MKTNNRHPWKLAFPQEIFKKLNFLHVCLVHFVKKLDMPQLQLLYQRERNRKSSFPRQRAAGNTAGQACPASSNTCRAKKCLGRSLHPGTRNALPARRGTQVESTERHRFRWELLRYEVVVLSSQFIIDGFSLATAKKKIIAVGQKRYISIERVKILTVHALKRQMCKVVPFKNVETG